MCFMLLVVLLLYYLYLRRKVIQHKFFNGGLASGINVTKFSNVANNAIKYIFVVIKHYHYA